MKKSKNVTPAPVAQTQVTDSASLSVISEYMTTKSLIKKTRGELKALVAKRQALEVKVEAAMNLPGGYRIRILNPKKEK